MAPDYVSLLEIEARPVQTAHDDAVYMKSLRERSPDLFERAFAVREERQKKAQARAEIPGMKPSQMRRKFFHSVCGCWT
jgi:hypothetical protein